MQPKELYLILKYDTDSRRDNLLSYLNNESNLKYELIHDELGEITIVISPSYLINTIACKEYLIELHKIFVKFTDMFPRLEVTRGE